MLRPTVYSLFLLIFTLATLGRAQQPASAAATAPTASPFVQPTTAPATAPAPGPSQVIVLLHEALELLQKKDIDGAFDKVNAAIKLDPTNPDGYGLRGGIYAEKKMWDKSEQDYNAILKLDPKNVQAKFNLAEIAFMQKKYDAARPQFVALQQDSNWGDLSTYKVFLCDLWGGHNDMAAKELAALEKVGSGASYYFAEAAWYLYQKKPEDARGWLVSAVNIYSPAKFKMYSASLFDLGYLPLPPQQKS